MQEFPCRSGIATIVLVNDVVHVKFIPYIAHLIFGCEFLNSNGLYDIIIDSHKKNNCMDVEYLIDPDIMEMALKIDLYGKEKLFKLPLMADMRK